MVSRGSGASVAPNDCSRTEAMQISGTQMRLVCEIFGRSVRADQERPTARSCLDQAIGKFRARLETVRLTGISLFVIDSTMRGER